MQFTRGQKSKLSALTPSQQIEVGVRVTGGGHEADTVLCLVLGADQKVVDPQSVVGAHSPTGGGGFIVWQGAKDGDTGVVWIDLAQLPAGQRLAIVVGGGQPFSSLASGQVRISAVGGGEVMTFPFGGGDFSGEKAIIVTELYVKDEWRVAAMGLGFNDGMPALLASYGAAPIPGAAPAAPAPPPAAPPPP
ncbi:MAG TPA: TerD family protein, partial [Iamia sp.]|nr:TerD family protein [Iamia sp.]